MAQGKRTQEYAEEFIASQQRWLECNLCPACYCAAKEANPNTRPNDPPTLESEMRDAVTGALLDLIRGRTERRSS